MPTPLACYRVLVSSPSDAMDEHDVAFDACVQISKEYGLVTGIVLWPTDWVHSAHADSGAEPQRLINHQLVDDCDIVVAFFRGKLGTPTESYESGTVEEIERALDAGKHVAVYFWEPGEGVPTEAASERARIEAYRASLGGRLLYKTYRSLDELRPKLKFDLTSLAHDLEGAAARAGLPRLSLRCIDGLELADDGLMRATGDFIASRVNLSAFDGTIREAYSEASSITLPPHDDDGVVAAFGSVGLGAAAMAYATDLEEVSDEDAELVLGELEDLGLQPCVGLFDLGRLRKGFHLAFEGSAGPFGTDDEKRKFDALSRLIDACANRRDLREYAGKYHDITGVLFALENSGGAPANGARVEIDLPDCVLSSPDQYPAPSDEFVGMLFDHGPETLERFYSAEDSAAYRSYYEAFSAVSMPPVYDSSDVLDVPGLYRSARGEEDFRDLIDGLTCWYDFKRTAVGLRLSVEFEKVQHNAVYAFPSYVLVRGAFPRELSWRIYCDDIPVPTDGVLALAAAGDSSEPEGFLVDG